ncbi:hypothetical protein [Sphaerimonospora cavernae]
MITDELRLVCQTGERPAEPVTNPPGTRVREQPGHATNPWQTRS